LTGLAFLWLLAAGLHKPEAMAAGGNASGALGQVMGGCAPSAINLRSSELNN